MAGRIAPRFKSRDAALRFYYRAGELLAPNASGRMFSQRRPPGVDHEPNLIDDMMALDSCFDELSEVQRWLLRELYLPRGFNPKPAPLANLFEAAKTRFPDYEWTPRRMAQFRREALKIVEARLVRERLA